MSLNVNHDRRRFLAGSALAIAAAQCGPIGCVETPSRTAQPANRTAGDAGVNMSFASIKQIDAGVLNVAYADTSPADGKPVILLHGWPYAIYSFVDVAP